MASLPQLSRLGATTGLTLLSTLLLAILFGWFYTQGDESPLGQFEWQLYDRYHTLRGNLEHDSRVVIVTIDEDSLAELGHWPWPRNKLGQIVSNLSDAGADLVAFDVLFPEETPLDGEFAEAIEAAGNVVLPIAFNMERQNWYDPTMALEDASFLKVEHSDLFEQQPPIMASGILPPVEELQEAALSMASVQAFPDADGTLRKEALAVDYDGLLFPSMALVLAARELGHGIEELVYEVGKGVRVDDQRFLPTDRYGMTLIPYYGGQKSFPYFSAVDVYNHNFPDQAFKGRIVLIGATAVGLYDLVVTPYSAGQPGVEKHANLIQAILDKRVMHQANTSSALTVLIVTALLFAISSIVFRAKGTLGFGLLIILGVLASGYLAFSHYALLIPVAQTALMLVSSLLLALAIKYLIEERRAGNIRAMFSSYVTARVVNELMRNPSIAKLGGQRRKITVLFSDIRGFTSISEASSPEEVVTTLNEYLGEMTDSVFLHEGTLDKYIGDAVMAFWGAPLEQKDQARLALSCALDMLERLDRLNAKWAHQHRPSMQIGIGLNTGEVLVGNIGAEGKKMDYTVIGDNVNLASRCESLNKELSTQLVVSEFTAAEIGLDEIFRLGLEDRGSFKVKGKQHAVRIYAKGSLLEPQVSDPLLDPALDAELDLAADQDLDTRAQAG